jgi:hypothetical protein
MRITIDELRRSAELLLAHLEESGCTEVEIDQDFYWSIDPEHRYQVYSAPTNFSVGQLTADWKELSDLLTGRNEPIGYGLVWLSAILRAVGEKNVA